MIWNAATYGTCHEVMTTSSSQCISESMNVSDSRRGGGAEVLISDQYNNNCIVIVIVIVRRQNDESISIADFFPPN
jgi:hypothetical protein